MKSEKEKRMFSRENVRKRRKFPLAKTLLLIALIAIQLFMIFCAIFYESEPKDLIERYSVTVEPRVNGTLDISYSFVWKALDDSEELTWVNVGMANESFSVYESSLSDTIKSYSKTLDGDYIALRLDFKDSYVGGETVKFSFKINQKNMLCKDDYGYFYEFIPGWFNAIPVENYTFKWRLSDDCTLAKDAKTSTDYYIWSGELEPGGYRRLLLRYSTEAFEGARAMTGFTEFDSSGAFNELASDKKAFVFFAIFIILLMALIEVFLIDCVVSYSRGRGFITGYGHHMHLYGRTNPKYEKERSLHSSGGRGGFGGGCACACACACAGGGRAGCSSKDTYTNLPFTKKS